MELREELNSNPVFAGRSLTLQQDGAPAHYALIVREFLDQFFSRLDWERRRSRVASTIMTGHDSPRFSIQLPDIQTTKNVITAKLNNDKPLLQRICKTVKKPRLRCVEKMEDISSISCDPE